MKKSLIITIFFTLNCLFLSAQRITILDKSDLQPVSQVHISNISKTLLLFTDVKGVADISIFSDKDTIIFNHVAFQTLKVIKSEVVKTGKNIVYITENVIKLDEFVFTANRREEKKSDLPYKIEVIGAKEIAFENPQTSAQMLEQTGEVFVQQSQMGGGSPVLRGFEANKVLLVVDGVRMNNAIYRSGHLQNAITVDPFVLSSTEILYGPGSVIYGSDALGGVISFRTREPILSGNGFRVNGDMLGRFSSVNKEKTGGINLNLGWKKVGALLNFSYSDFDDLHSGKERNPFYGDWGKSLFYTERINGVDSMITNDHPEVQKKSGYSQYNMMGKILYRHSSAARYLINVQYSNSSDIPRYDRLTELDTAGNPRYAEWFYGPQQRLFASLTAEYRVKSLLYDNASVIIAYQNIHEDRISRSFRKSRKKFNFETADVLSLNADLGKKIFVKDDLQYGIEVTFNNIGSKVHQENIVTGLKTEDLATRYPDDKATMLNIAAYASNSWKINTYFSFSQGIRLSYVELRASYTDTMMNIMKFPFDRNITQSNSALNGYLGIISTPGKDWKFSLLGSTGFRTPNIDDLGKLNDSNSEQNMIIVPNPELRPEYAYNLDFSFAKTISGVVRLEGSAFYTWLIDALAVAPSTYKGQDSLMYDGSMSKVYSTENSGRAYIYGFQGNLLAQVTKIFAIESNLSYTFGILDATDRPLDHIPPLYGMTSFKLELKKFKGSFYVMYNGWKRLNEYSDSGEDNLVYASVYGTPSWYTLNLKMSYQIVKYVNAEVGMENILDDHYRKFASGISSPGRNLILALRANF